MSKTTTWSVQGQRPTMSRAHSGTNESCDALKVESREEYCSKAPWTTFAWLKLLFCPSLFLLKCNLLTARAFFGFFLGFFTFLKFEEKIEVSARCRLNGFTLRKYFRSFFYFSQHPKPLCKLRSASVTLFRKALVNIQLSRIAGWLALPGLRMHALERDSSPTTCNVVSSLRAHFSYLYKMVRSHEEDFYPVTF